MYWLVWALIFLSLSLLVINQNNDNFGPYRLVWEKFEVCKGPKQTECGVFRIDNFQNMSDVLFVINFPKDCPVTKARVTIGNKQSNNTIKKMWNYALDTPCQHFVLGPILIKSFNLTSNCKITKGSYEIHLDMLATSTMFLGNSFFYGNYRFKIIAHNKNNNFFCVDAILKVERKNKV